MSVYVRPIARLTRRLWADSPHKELFEERESCDANGPDCRTTPQPDARRVRQGKGKSWRRIFLSLSI